MKAYKKNIVVENIGSFKKAYYSYNGELYNCGTFTKSYTIKEIKEQIIKDLEDVEL